MFGWHRSVHPGCWAGRGATKPRRCVHLISLRKQEKYSSAQELRSRGCNSDLITFLCTYLAWDQALIHKMKPCSRKNLAALRLLLCEGRVCLYGCLQDCQGDLSARKAVKLDIGYRFAAFVFTEPCPTGSGARLIWETAWSLHRIKNSTDSTVIMLREIVLTLELIPIKHIGFSP